MPPHHLWPIRVAREDTSGLRIGDRHGNGKHGLAHPLKDANPSDQNLPIEVEAVPPKTLPTLVVLNSPSTEGYFHFLGCKKLLKPAESTGRVGFVDGSDFPSVAALSSVLSQREARPIP